jgi:hypothetical protein
MVLAVLLVIGGVERNPGPVVEGDNTATFMYWLWLESKVGNPM